MEQTHKRKSPALLLVAALLFAVLNTDHRSSGRGASPYPAPAAEAFRWPQGKRAAVSFSFDDARLSQIDTGLALINRHHVKVTFFVNPGGVEKRLPGWRQAVASGHEIANHSLTHPCTGNYPFSRHNALEDYTLSMMARQIDGGNQQIHRLLGVTPRTFAYPCGQKFVGRGAEVKSYVPLVAQRYIVGRGYLDESPNDPSFCDLAQAMGAPLDDLDYGQMKVLVDKSVEQGRWIIFVSHEIGAKGYQRTDASAFGTLCDYVRDPARGIWVDTVEAVGKYVQQERSRR